MPITNTDEFIPYASFNDSGGITTSDTFNAWRKKTNGIINAIDSINVTNVGASQLSLGAPTWTTAGNLSTYKASNGVLGSFTASVITCGSIITSSIRINGDVVSTQSINSNSLFSQSLTLIGGTGTISTNGAIQAHSLAVGTNNTKFTVSSLGAVVGSSLKVGGSGTIATGAVGALSLAVGTNNTQFTVTEGGAVVGSSLNVGSGTITAGSITGTLISASTSIRSNGTLTCNSFEVKTGTAASVASINVNGDATARSFNSTSSLRYKQNVQPLCNALDTIEKLQGVTFDWKETGQSDVGLIAEHVNEVLPQFVLKNEQGEPTAVDYGKLTSVLIEAVKELSALVKSKN